MYREAGHSVLVTSSAFIHFSAVSIINSYMYMYNTEEAHAFITGRRKKRKRRDLEANNYNYTCIGQRPITTLDKKIIVFFALSEI